MGNVLLQVRCDSCVRDREADMKKIGLLVAAVLSLGLFLTGPLSPPDAVAITINATIDTSALSGAAAQLAFDLIDGDGAVDNTVSISGFLAQGATLGSPSTTGGVTGILPGPVMLSDTDFFNELLQPITFGSSLSFVLDLTTHFSGSGLPDALSFFILNSAATGSLVTTTEPSGSNALFQIDLVGPPTGIEPIVFSATTPIGAPVPVVLTAPGAAVPEPGSLVLMATGVVLIAWHARRARQHPS